MLVYGSSFEVFVLHVHDTLTLLYTEVIAKVLHYELTRTSIDD